MTEDEILLMETNREAWCLYLERMKAKPQAVFLTRSPDALQAWRDVCAKVKAETGKDPHAALMRIDEEKRSVAKAPQLHVDHLDADGNPVYAKR